MGGIGSTSLILHSIGTSTPADAGTGSAPFSNPGVLKQPDTLGPPVAPSDSNWLYGPRISTAPDGQPQRTATHTATDPHASERQKRTAIMDAMLKDSGVGSGDVAKHRRDVVQHAMDAYSLDQLDAIQKNAVQFKFEAPPDGDSSHTGLYQRKDGHATIFLRPSTIDSTEPDGDKIPGQDVAEQVVRHEMAHAWDDAQYPDQGSILEKSQSNDVVYTDKNGHGWTINAMYQSYMKH